MAGMSASDRPPPHIMAAHRAIRAARLVTPGDEEFGKGGPSAVLEELGKLKAELANVVPFDLPEDVTAYPRLENIRAHVDDLIASGRTLGAPELWTLSAAIDRLVGLGDAVRG